MSAPDHQLLWQLCAASGNTRCQMLTCCTGAELQVVKDDVIVLRELYPDKSDLFERAGQLKTDLERALMAEGRVGWASGSSTFRRLPSRIDGTRQSLTQASSPGLAPAGGADAYRWTSATSVSAGCVHWARQVRAAAPGDPAADETLHRQARPRQATPSSAAARGRPCDG
jgi:hypothetical protein